MFHFLFIHIYILGLIKKPFFLHIFLYMVNTHWVDFVTSLLTNPIQNFLRSTIFIFYVKGLVNYDVGWKKACMYHVMGKCDRV